jgi:CBS domain-containing protein
MRTARDVMHSPPPTIAPETSVQTAAAQVLRDGVDGLCVVEGDRFIGVITTMDLLIRGKAPHAPPVFVILDVVFPIENPLRTSDELDRITARNVGGLMTTEVQVATPDTPVGEIVRWMIDKHLSLIPVIEHGRLIGIVTKPAMLREAYGLGRAPSE